MVILVVYESREWREEVPVTQKQKESTMSAMLNQARAKTHAEDHVTVVVWDNDMCSGRRDKMAYKKAKALAAQDRPDGRYEHRIILVPAF